MSFFRPNKYKTLTDLVHACQKQDARAQTVLYERYKTKLAGVCARYARTDAEAEDIFQDSLVKVFRFIQELKEPESVDSWVKSVVVRTAINYYNRTTKTETLSVSLDLLGNDPENDDYGRIIDQIDMAVLMEVINQLPDGYRIVINMHLIDDYTHVEIAKMLSIAESTSRSQYMRGRNLLLMKLQELGITQNEIY